MDVQTKTVTILTGATGLSDVFDIGDHTIGAFVMPETFLGTYITFQASEHGGTFYNLYDDAGTMVSVKVAASRVVSLDTVAMKLAPLQQIKIRSSSDSSGTAQNEGSTRTIKLLLK